MCPRNTRAECRSLSRPASPTDLNVQMSMPRSLWAAFSAAAPPCGPLTADLEVDVAIVGAGYTGLSAAIDLAVAGRRVAVLESAEIGCGASGRNNGQVIPGLKLDPDDVVRRLGEAAGERLVEWSGHAPSIVFDLITSSAIECDLERNGWIQPAYTRKAIATIESRCRQWRSRGGPVEMLPSDALPSILGTNQYHAAWLDRRGGALNPLAYVRGLARRALQCGGRIFTQSPAIGLEDRGGRWCVRTQRAEVRAASVIVATGAYSDRLVPGLRRTIVPLRTAQVATFPLTEHVHKAILPGRQAASDTRRLLTSFRVTPQQRLMMGGADATGGALDERLVRSLHCAATELFGHLGDLKWEFGWSGLLALTEDHLPHIHAPSRGLLAALGCNGRGIAVSTAMGRALAQYVLRGAEAELPLPVTGMRPVRFFALRNVGIALATSAKRVLDSIDRAAPAKE